MSRLATLTAVETSGDQGFAHAEPERRNRPAYQPDRYKMSAVVIEDPDLLEQHIADWEELAADALEPNVFYEPWMLMPALRSLAGGRRFVFVLVLAVERHNPRARPVLCGLFPLERTRSYKGLPLTVLSLWRHEYCSLCTPLVRTGFARPCLAAFFDWLAADDLSGAVMSFRFVSGEGPFHEALTEELHRRRAASFTCECFTRAFFRPGVDGASYLKAAVSNKKWKATRRKERRLAETGTMKYVTLGGSGDAEAWMEDFLRLEASGWKGREGTAIACRAGDTRFFVAVVAEACRRGRLMMLALEVDGRPIAQLINFLAGQGSFAYKIAFDENYARYSPGWLLEIENVRRLHERDEIKWMDSCAASDQNLLNHLWVDRKIIHSVLVATGRGAGAFAVSAMPLLRWLKRRLGPRFLRRKRGLTGRKDELRRFDV